MMGADKCAMNIDWIQIGRNGEQYVRYERNRG